MKRTICQSIAQQRSTSRACQAYTLIELLIVVGVLGLAASLLIPSLNNTDSLSIQGAVRRVIGDLHFAQSDALAQQEYRRVEFFDDGSGYVITRSPFNAASDYITDPMARAGTDQAYIVLFSTDERFEGIEISAVDIDGGEDFITYDELGGTITDGGDAGTGGTIILTSPNAEYRITVAGFTGKLTVEDITP